MMPWKNLIKKLAKTTSFFSPVVLVSVMGCLSPPQPSLVDAPDLAPMAPIPPRAQVPVSPWAGTWEGRDSRGDTYVFMFTDNEWESFYERNGNTVPFFRGTYTYAPGRAELQIKEEVDASRMKWKVTTIVFPSITGRLNGVVLNLENLTDANLIKR